MKHNNSPFRAARRPEVIMSYDMVVDRTLQRRLAEKLNGF